MASMADAAVYEQRRSRISTRRGPSHTGWCPQLIPRVFQAVQNMEAPRPTICTTGANFLMCASDLDSVLSTYSFTATLRSRGLIDTTAPFVVIAVTKTLEAEGS